MPLAARLRSLTRGITSPTAISGLQAWYSASNISVASVQPNTISGLQLWLKADALVLNDADPVGTWADSSGNGYDATQATAGKKPLYKTNIVNSLPVVRFDGSDDFLQLAVAGFLASTNNVTGITVFAVVKATTTGVSQKVIHISNNVAATVRYTLNANAASHWEQNVRRLDADSVTTLSGTTALPGAFQVVTGRCNYNPRTGTGSWLQGANETKSTTLTSAGSTSATNSADAFVGAGSTASANKFSGDIAELIVYNVSLTDQQRLAVEKYLCDKYALTAIGAPYVNADVVQCWKDLSGNNYDLLQNTAANKPTYRTNVVNGKPSVRFDGLASYMLTFAFASLPQPFTYVCVVQENDLTVDTNNFMDCITGTSVKLSGTYNAHPTNPSQYLIDSTTGIYGGTNTDTNWHVYTVNWDATDIARKDGVTQVSGDTGSGATTGVHVGATNGVSKFLHGDMAEVLLYNKALSTAELNLIGQYFASLYGTTWTAV